MVSINVGDRVAVVDLLGSYRITSIEGRKVTGHREFEGGKIGNVRTFDVLDVATNLGGTPSQDDGVAPPQALEDKGSLTLEAKLQRKREGKERTEVTPEDRKSAWEALYGAGV